MAKIGDKCTGQFFKSVRERNVQAVISKLRTTMVEVLLGGRISRKYA